MPKSTLFTGHTPQTYAVEKYDTMQNGGTQEVKVSTKNQLSMSSVRIDFIQPRAVIPMTAGPIGFHTLVIARVTSALVEQAAQINEMGILGVLKIAVLVADARLVIGLNMIPAMTNVRSIETGANTTITSGR